MEASPSRQGDCNISQAKQTQIGFSSLKKKFEGKKNRYSHGGFKKWALLETARDEKNGSIILEILSLFSSLYHTSEFLIYFLS